MLRGVLFLGVVAAILVACDLPILHPSEDAITKTCGQWPVTDGCKPGYCCSEHNRCTPNGCEAGDEDAPGVSRATPQRRWR